MQNHKTSLVAEMDEEVASEIKLYLCSLGHTVYPVISRGEDLLQTAINVHPSLIITDVNLRGQLDGIEAIARMEEIFKTQYIFITRYDDYSRLISSYYLNPISLIRKPLEHQNMVKSIAKFVYTSSCF